MGPVYSLTPAAFVDTVAVLTRVNQVTARYKRPVRIDEIRYSFALNTQRNLELSFWWVDSPAFADDTYPQGSNLLAESGADFHVVGDGQEGEQVLRIARWMPPGFFCVSANNTSALNPHTLDCKFFASQSREETGYARR